MTDSSELYGAEVIVIPNVPQLDSLPHAVAKQRVIHRFSISVVLPLEGLSATPCCESALSWRIPRSSSDSTQAMISSIGCPGISLAILATVLHPVAFIHNSRSFSVTTSCRLPCRIQHSVS